MYKSIVLMLGCLLAVGSISAQVKKDINASGVKTLILKVDQMDLKIIGTSSSQISIEAGSIKPMPERAKGLRPLYNSASDNTGAGMEMKKEGDVMYLSKARSGSGEYTLRVPKSIQINILETDWMGGSFHLSGLTGEIEIESKSSSIVMEKVSGPITANSTAGNIDIVFSNLNQSKPCFISNISGHIDVTLGSQTKANVQLQNIAGEVYSNYDLGEVKDGMRSFGGQNIKSAINGGGVEFRLKNISGDIYLRK